MFGFQFSGRNRFVLYFFLPVVVAILGGGLFSLVSVSSFSQLQHDTNQQQLRDKQTLAGSMDLGMDILQVQKDLNDMAQRVQFIFITHNKSTMELASQLLGVTMNEPGVSRLVAVDVDEALRLAAS